MNRLGPKVAVLSSVLLAAPLCLATAADGAPRTVNTIAAGVIRGADGAPEPGAVVSLTWGDFQRGKVGARVDPVTITTAVADKDGQYQLAVDPGAIPAAAAKANGGVTNFEVTVATANGEHALVGVPRRATSGRWASGRAQDAARSAADSVTLDIRTSPAGAASTSGQSVVAASSYCSWYLTAVRGATTRVFEMHSVSKTKFNWSYGTTADSTIDLAVSASPGQAYSVSGSYSVNNSRSSTSGVGDTSGSRHSYAATGFNYNGWTLKPDNSTATSCSNTTYRPGATKIIPASWIGGASYLDTIASIGCNSSWNSSWRAYYVTNGYLNKVTSDTKKISAAVTVGGATLGQVTSYGTAADIHWSWSSPGYACGSNAAPSVAQVVWVG